MEDVMKEVEPNAPSVNIPWSLYESLKKLGIIHDEVRNFNVGASNYSKHLIQPWAIWMDWDLNPWDADIVKRVLRTKEGESRVQDYEKIIHICQERIRQLICQSQLNSERKHEVLSDDT